MILVNISRKSRFVWTQTFFGVDLELDVEVDTGNQQVGDEVEDPNS